MNPFENREVLLGVTGGVAAYKAAELASRLVQSGARVTTVLTPAALEFVGRTTFEALTGRPTYVELFQPKEHHRGEHIGLARRADVLLVAPASADYLAKVAHGLADDLLSTLTLAMDSPGIFAPAMNAEMWAKPAVARNVALLQADGWKIVPPGDGWLSCGVVGPGRLADPEQILSAVASLLERTPPRSAGT